MKPTFRIGTYNVLCHIPEQEMIDYIPNLVKYPQILDFKQRTQLVIQNIKKNNLDLMFLQELDDPDIYKRDLTEFEFVFQKANADDRTFGDMIGIKRLNWQYIKTEIVYFSDLAEILIKQDPKWTDLEKRFKQPQTGIISLIKHKQTNKQLILVCTHITSSPTLQDVKYAQIKYLLFRIEQFQHSNNLIDIDIIFGGDLNSTPDSAGIDLILGTVFNKQSFNFIQNPRKITQQQFVEFRDNMYQLILSVEKSLKYDIQTRYYCTWDNKRDQLPENRLNTYPKLTFARISVNDRFQGTLDYIFFTNKQIKLLKKSNQKFCKNINDQYSAPNDKQPSSHFLIYADFRFV